MLNLRISSPGDKTDDVLRILQADPGVSSLSVVRGASLRPVGDLVTADVAREAANDVIEGLRGLGVHREGSLRIDPVGSWISQNGYEAERRTPGSGADAVVWAEVTQRAYEDSELNWTYVSFITLATLIASIAIVLDSQILVIGAMVLGPEFGAIAALGVALVRRRYGLLGLASRTLAGGFAIAIAITTVVILAAKLDHPRGRDGAAARNRLHLLPGQVVVHRGSHRCRSRSPLHHLRQDRGPVRSIHLGHHHPGSRKRRAGPRLRRRR
jgi:hypothetical protein